MKPKVLKVDIEKLRTYGEWPCLSYSLKLIEEGVKKNTRLEVWNYKREKPEADWIVPNIGKYAEDAENIKKRGVRLGFNRGRCRRGAPYRGLK